MNTVRIPKYRYDYFLIWGHGLAFKKEILNLIRQQPDLEIKKLIAHRPKSIKHLVRAVYSFDYAPYFHLRSKTRYLMDTPKEVLFVFVKNLNPDEDWIGQGEFRHVESKTLKPIKEEIRNMYNDRINGKRTENHVIHASDNELQTSHILNYLGVESLSYLSETTPVLNLPSYIEKYETFTIEIVDIESLKCLLLTGDRFNYKTKLCNISESPHFLCLGKDHSIYQEYIDRFIGGPLKQDYSLERFLKLAYEFEYLQNQKSSKYIIVKPISENQYLILDGLHRASIMLLKKARQFPVAILY